MNRSSLQYQSCIVLILIISFCRLQAQEFELKVQHEGYSQAVGYYNDYVYFNSGGNLNILKREDDSSFAYINRIHCYNNYLSHISIDNGIMFLSAFGKGVLIYDLNDPENPELLSIANVNFVSPRATIVVDSILISMGEAHAAIFDITNPQQPEYLSEMYFMFNRKCTYALNNDMFYGFYQDGYSGPQYLHGYNISDPADPMLTVSLQISPDYHGTWPDVMAAQDDILFAGFNDTIKMYDISDSDTIAYVTRFPVPGSVNIMKLAEDTVYLAVADTGMLVYDLSDMYNPELIAAYEKEHTFYNFEIGADYFYSGFGIYGFIIADKSDMQNINDVYEYTRTDAAYAVHIRDDQAYVGMKRSGLQIIDIGDVYEPIYYGNIESLSSIETIKSIPGYLYCEMPSDPVIQIVDVSDNSNPKQAGEIIAQHSWIIDYCIDEDRLFMVDSLDYIAMYDLSVPDDPVLVTTFNERGHSIAVIDSIMILSESSINRPERSESKLKIFILNESNIYLHHEVDLGSYSKRAFQIEIGYPFVYVRTAEGVIMLKFDSDNYLSVCDELSWNGLTEKMDYNDTFIYLSGYFTGSSELIIIDKTDPYNLVVFQSFERGFEDIASFGSYLLCTARHGGYYFYGQQGVGLEEDESVRKGGFISCYPNPVLDELNIRSGSRIDNLYILNLHGQILLNKKLNGQPECKADVGFLPPGVYLLKIKTAKGIVTKKFLKIQ